jgi:beta-glucosidase
MAVGRIGVFKKENHCTLTKTEIEKKAGDLLSRMTLKEKVWLLHGNWDLLRNLVRYRNPYNPVPIRTNGLKRLGIPPVSFTDGPRGVVMGRSTCFPVSMARGASFDRALERKVGNVIGKEARAQGANLFGGVCVNLLRHPAWGRAQETYGEDPFHVGEMGRALTESVQEHNVMACLKHYAVNNIENSRFFVNVRADGRTMREVYLPHFRKSIEAGAACVMGAYNRYEGDQACESRTLLTDILRGEWGFEGFTISDFIFGVRDGTKAIEAGLDIEMPLPIEYKLKLLQAVESGKVAESTIDRAALRVIRTLLVFGNTPDPMDYTKKLVACPAHRLLAREVAEKSMVLIKNSGNVLPFKKNARTVLVLGGLASRPNTGDRGSSRVYAPWVVTPLEGIKKYFGGSARVIHRTEAQIEEAKELAAVADCVIIVAGCSFNDEGEHVSPGGLGEFLPPVIAGHKNMGLRCKAALLKLVHRFMANASLSKKIMGDSDAPVGGDRTTLSLRPEQAALIREAGAINPNTVVTLVCGSMIMMDDWADRVPAVLYSWYAGMEGGAALPRVLFGDVNPSGKLPFTIPSDVAHLPCFSSIAREITYNLYHGYTLLDRDGHRPAYPFGFGLSYTTYSYAGVRVEKSGSMLSVNVEITNTGPVDGEEVVQVYAGMASSRIERQKKLLRGFEKVYIRAGETAKVSIPVSLEDLRYYSIEEKRWILELGTYVIMVGPSSDDEALLTASVEL